VSALAGRDRRRRGQSAKRLKWVEAEHEATRAHNGRRVGVVLLSWAGLGCIWFGPVAALQRADDFDLVQLIREFHRVLCAVKKEVNHEEQSPGQYFWHPPLIYTLPRSLFLARRI
jgi:hypothetical protein